MTNDDFDPSVLRRLDRPRRPSPAATAAIRSAMLAAFDDATSATVVSTDTDDETDDETDRRTTEVTNERPAVRAQPSQVVELQPRSPGSAGAPADGDDDGRRYGGRIVRYAAVAAGIVALVAGLVALRQTDDPATVDEAATADVDTVVSFCLEAVDPLVDDLENFLAEPGGELSDRAVRNSELLAQRYRDLAPLLSEPLATDVAATGDDLLEQAAATRSGLIRGDDDAVIVGLIDAIVTAIDGLPGSGTCRLGQVRNSTA